MLDVGSMTRAGTVIAHATLGNQRYYWLVANRFSPSSTAVTMVPAHAIEPGCGLPVTLPAPPVGEKEPGVP